MSKYLDPKADLTFKKVFGEHPHLVISLLNAMLPLKEGEQIEHIEYWPADKIPDRTEAEKYSIVDVCCHDSKGREFIVEMQMSWTDSFKKRVLLNATKAYVAQTKKGMDYADIQPVYALNFVNENFLHDVDDYYHYYHIVHERYTNKVIDGLHFVFVELKKFKPQTFSQKKMQVLWLRFLTEIDEHTNKAPDELLENADVNEALEMVERAAFSQDELYVYNKFWDRISTQITWENDWKRRESELKRKKEEAEAKVEEAEAKAEQFKVEAEELKAEAEKLKARHLESARRMKADGVPLSLIEKYTGLSAKDLEALLGLEA